MFYSAGVSLICKFHVLGAVIYTTAPTHVKGVPGPEWIGSLSTSWALIVWDSMGKEEEEVGSDPQTLTDQGRTRAPYPGRAVGSRILNLVSAVL